MGLLPIRFAKQPGSDQLLFHRIIVDTGPAFQKWRIENRQQINREETCVKKVGDAQVIFVHRS